MTINFYYPANPGYFTNPDTTNGGVSFYTGTYSAGNFKNQFHIVYDGDNGHFLGVGDNSAFNYGVMIASPVPEIDGALIPQVGFLLAGLFLMFGRRKENPEPMLAN